MRILKSRAPRAAPRVLLGVVACLLAETVGPAVADEIGTAVPLAGIDAESWLCVLDAGGAGNQDGAGLRGQTVGSVIGVGLCRELSGFGGPTRSSDTGGATAPDAAASNVRAWPQAGPPDAVAIDIPDPGLRSAVESALGKGAGEPVEAIEMASLTALAARGAGISDLSGLEFAVNLRHLDLGRNAVSDLSPLVGLSGLEMLSLERNGIGDDDLSVLAGLVGLEVLSLARNEVEDLSTVAGLPRLRVLDLAETTIGSLSVLAGLTRLEGLYLGGNGIEDVSVLSGLRGLRWLILTGNAIEDISPLAGLTGLEALDLSGNAVGDLSPLAGLTGLNMLVLSGNAVEDLSPLTGLTGLREPRLGGNAIEDISPLIQNPGLDDGDLVVLSGNPLSLESRNVFIPLLEERGANVEFDGNATADIPGGGVRRGTQDVVVPGGPGIRRIAVDDNESNSLLVQGSGFDDGDPVALSGNSLSRESLPAHDTDPDPSRLTVGIDAEATFSAQRVISTDADRARSVHAADLDGDGDVDVLSASFLDDKIAWYANLGGGQFSSQRVISTAVDEPTFVQAADLDGDGDHDVLSAYNHHGLMAWHENLGGGRFSAARMIANGFGWVEAFAADLEGDGDADLLYTDFNTFFCCVKGTTRRHGQASEVVVSPVSRACSHVGAAKLGGVGVPASGPAPVSRASA